MLTRLFAKCPKSALFSLCLPLMLSASGCPSAHTEQTSDPQREPAAAASDFPRGQWPRRLPDFVAGDMFWDMDWNIDALSQAIKVNPADADAYFYRGILYLKELNREARSLADFKTSLRLRPDFAPAWVYLGELYYGQTHDSKQPRNYAQALSAYQRALELKTDMPIVYLRHAALFYARGRYEEAITAVTRLNQVAVEDKTQPEVVDAYFIRAAAYQDTGRFQQALADYSHIVEKGQKMLAVELISPSRVHCARGRAYFDLGRYPEAIAEFSAAITFAQGLATPDPEKYIALYYRGLSHFSLKQRTKAKADFDQVSALLPQAELDSYDQGIASFLTHLENLEDDLIRPAISDYNRALRLRPNEPMMLVLRAKANAAKGLDAEAVTDFSRAIAHKDAGVLSMLALLPRAEAYRTQGKAVQALADYNEFIRISPEFDDGYLRRAFAHHRHGRLADEIADYNAAIKLTPENVDALISRAYAQARLGRFDAAAQDLVRASKLKPGYPTLHETHGWLAWLQHKPDEAQAAFTQAVAALEKTKLDQEVWSEYLAFEVPLLLQTLRSSVPAATREQIEADLELARFGDREALARVYSQMVELGRGGFKTGAVE